MVLIFWPLLVVFSMFVPMKAASVNAVEPLYKQMQVATNASSVIAPVDVENQDRNRKDK